MAPSVYTEKKETETPWFSLAYISSLRLFWRYHFIWLKGIRSLHMKYADRPKKNSTHQHQNVNPKQIYSCNRKQKVHLTKLQTNQPHRTRDDLEWAGNGDAKCVTFVADCCFLNGKTKTGPTWFSISAFKFFVVLFEAWSCSSVAKTSAMRGLTFASWLKHCKAIVAAVKAAFWGYCPSSFMSIIRNNFLLSLIYGFAQSTRFCSTPVFVLSTARRPDNNSSKTTPKLYTSLFVVNRPVR